MLYKLNVKYLGFACKVFKLGLWSSFRAHKPLLPTSFHEDSFLVVGYQTFTGACLANEDVGVGGLGLSPATYSQILRFLEDWPPKPLPGMSFNLITNFIVMLNIDECSILYVCGMVEELSLTPASECITTGWLPR